MACAIADASPEPTSDELVSASAEACGGSIHPSILHLSARARLAGLVRAACSKTE